MSGATHVNLSKSIKQIVCAAIATSGIDAKEAFGAALHRRNSTLRCTSNANAGGRSSRAANPTTSLKSASAECHFRARAATLCLPCLISRTVPSWRESFEAPWLHWPTRPRGEISNGRKLKAKANVNDVASRPSRERPTTKTKCSYGRHTDSREALSQLSRHSDARTSALRI